MTRPSLILPADQIDTHRFDAIIDTRSPAEYAEDHVPGAINCPVLSDTERAEIGTLYKQVSPFEARKRGAILTARNIAMHIEQLMLDHPKSWRPLIYCWRGGQRSGAMQIILREIGWDALRVEGGYKAYRAHVLSLLDSLPGQFRYVVVGGPTGAGKTRLLAALHRAGAQVIDLEDMADHKGSVLGRAVDDGIQSRKRFDSKLAAALRGFDPNRPVYIEAESRRIGIVHLPPALFQAMQQARCLYLDPPLEARIDFLVQDYADLIAKPDDLLMRLMSLAPLHAKETMASWAGMVAAGDWPALTRDLLIKHYDPLYKRSNNGNFTQMPHAPRYTPARLDDDSLDLLSREIIATFGR